MFEERQSGFAQVSGARLYYEFKGKGEPLVLLHAGIADGRMWDRQFDAFAGRYRVIRYDRRGFGRTEAAESASYSHHEDLRGLLDLLGARRALLVGCSMGAKTAIDFALEFPERTRALVLVGPSVGGFEPEVDPPEELDELVAADEAGDLERVSELEVRMWVDGPYREPEGVDPAVRDLVRDMNLIALKNEAAGSGVERSLEPPAVDRLDEIRVPALIVVGDLDRPEVSARADLLEKRLANAYKVEISGTAHVPNMERPEEFNRFVLGFLDELDA